LARVECPELLERWHEGRSEDANGEPQQRVCCCCPFWVWAAEEEETTPPPQPQQGVTWASAGEPYAVTVARAINGMSTASARRELLELLRSTAAG
jgi:hypothetical protein